MKDVCSDFKSGVVMFIDDLQWSDYSLLDLLQSLLRDEEIPSLLLVGEYRDYEVESLILWHLISGRLKG